VERPSTVVRDFGLPSEAIRIHDSTGRFRNEVSRKLKVFSGWRVCRECATPLNLTLSGGQRNFLSEGESYCLIHYLITCERRLKMKRKVCNKSHGAIVPGRIEPPWN